MKMVILTMEFRLFIKPGNLIDTLTESSIADISVKEQFQSHLGIELSFLEILQIRVGRYYEDENNGDRNYISRGFGLHYKFISVDYTRIYDKSELLNFDMDFYQLSVTIPW